MIKKTLVNPVKNVSTSNDALIEPPAPCSFEAAMTELTQLVAHMEAGELALEASIDAYTRGSELVRYCTAQLNKVEQQVKLLDGEILKPFQANSSDTKA